MVFHGRRHISRSIIFSDFMSRFLLEINKNIDLTAIRYAVFFHDSVDNEMVLIYGREIVLKIVKIIC